MMGKGENDQQSYEEAEDQIGKQNTWSDANSGNLVIKKSELKEPLSKRICISKELPFRIGWKTPVPFLGNPRE